MDNVICWISMTSSHNTKSRYVSVCSWSIFWEYHQCVPHNCAKHNLNPLQRPKHIYFSQPHPTNAIRLGFMVRLRCLLGPLPILCRPRCWSWCTCWSANIIRGIIHGVALNDVIEKSHLIPWDHWQWLLCLLWSCNRIGFANLIPVVEFSKFSDRLWIVGRRTQHPFWFRHTPFLNRACEPWMDHDPLAEQQPPFLTRFSTAGQRVPIIAQRHWNRNQILAQLLWPHCKSIGATTSRTPTPKKNVAERSDEWN